MTIAEMMDALLTMAHNDAALKERFLATRTTSDPLSAFCELGRSLGYPLYPMDIVSAGEEFYAEIRRSTNGGGENSPKLAGEDDFYELFFINL